MSKETVQFTLIYRGTGLQFLTGLRAIGTTDLIIPDYSMTLDGGNRYWNVNVDLTTKTLYGLAVNGVA